MSDLFYHQCGQFDACRRYAKHTPQMDRIALKLRPLPFSVFAQNGQMAIKSPFVMPASQLSVTEKALKSPNFATWDIFQTPVV